MEAAGFVLPIMICLTVATGCVSAAVAAAAAGVAARAVRSPAMMKPMPLMNSAVLTAKSQLMVRMHSLSFLEFHATVLRPYLRYSAGTTAMFRIVELTSPHRITMAIGVWIALP